MSNEKGRITMMKEMGPTWRFYILFVLVGAACSKNPADSSTAAKVQAPTPTRQQSKAPKGDSKTVELTGEIIFVGSKVTGNHVCKFNDWKGEANLSTVGSSYDFASTTISFTLNTQGVVVDFKDPKPWSKKLERHLRSADFFDSDQYPTATFVSSRIVAKQGNNSTHEITGNLTIKGISKSITFPVNLSQAHGKIKASAEFSINRRDFNIVYDGKPDDLVRDDVLLRFALDGK